MLKREEDGESGEHEDGQIALPHVGLFGSIPANSQQMVDDYDMINSPELLQRECGLVRKLFRHLANQSEDFLFTLSFFPVKNRYKFHIRDFIFYFLFFFLFFNLEI